jgi:ABC-type bacteriocin/lantibiotic exporter with double-glycine peptidase domain
MIIDKILKSKKYNVVTITILIYGMICLIKANTTILFLRLTWSVKVGVRLDCDCSTPLSTISQIYRGGQF